MAIQVGEPILYVLPTLSMNAGQTVPATVTKVTSDTVVSLMAYQHATDDFKSTASGNPNLGDSLVGLLVEDVTADFTSPYANGTWHYMPQPS